MPAGNNVLQDLFRTLDYIVQLGGSSAYTLEVRRHVPIGALAAARS
jgi:hypothetical protein